MKGIVYLTAGLGGMSGA